jgi:hypothetical protein
VVDKGSRLENNDRVTRENATETQTFDAVL